MVSHTLFLTQLLVFVDNVCVSAMRTILPYLARDLGVASHSISGLEALYGAGQVLGALVMGRLSDRRGRKSVLLLSFLGSATGNGIAALASLWGSSTLLFLSRVPVGLSKQTVSASRAVVSDVTRPGEARSTAQAKLFAAMALGYALGPYAGGLLVDHTRPELPALLCAFSFAGLVPLAGRLPETCAAARSPSGGAPKRPAAGAGLGLRFGARLPAVLLVTACCLLPEAAVLAGSVSVPVAGHALGWSASTNGLYHSVWGLGAGLFSLGPLAWALRTGWLTDRRSALLGTTSFGAAYLGVCCAGPSDAALWLSLLLTVPGIAMLRTSPAALVMHAAPADARGEALGVLDAASSCLRVLVPLLTGELAFRRGVVSPFGAQAALCAAGTALLLAFQVEGEAPRPKADRGRAERARDR